MPRQTRKHRCLTELRTSRDQRPSNTANALGERKDTDPRPSRQTHLQQFKVNNVHMLFYQSLSTLNSHSEVSHLNHFLLLLKHFDQRALSFFLISFSSVCCELHSRLLAFKVNEPEIMTCLLQIICRLYC